MQGRTQQIFGDRDRLLERAIVLQTLCDDRHDGWLRAELAVELGDREPVVIRTALTRLEEEGVVECAGERVRASRAAMHLDDLEMLAV